MAVGELHIEFVGGALDGLEDVIESVCRCCGEEIGPGALVTVRGHQYVVGQNRCYAFYVGIFTRREAA